MAKKNKRKINKDNGIKRWLGWITMSLIIPIVLGVITYNLTDTSKSRSSIETRLTKAENYIQKGIYIEALSQIVDISKDVSKNQFPTLYARLKYDEGFCLSRLPQSKENSLGAIEAFGESLSVLNKVSNPHQYAVSKMELGGAYLGLAQFIEAHVNIDKAMDSFNEALSLFSNNNSDFQVSETLGYKAKARILAAQYAMKNNEKSIGEAVDDYLRNAINDINEAKRLFDPSRNRYLYAGLLRDMGTAYWIWGSYTNSEENFRSSINSYEEALEYCSLEIQPMQYASIHTNLGNVYRDDAKIKNDSLLLKKAQNSYETALKICRREKNPHDFILIKYNQAISYLYLSNITKQSDSLTQALDTLNEAQNTIDNVNSPLMNANIQLLKGAIYLRLAKFENDSLNKDKAYEEFHNALKIYKLTGDSEKGIMAMGFVLGEITDKLRHPVDNEEVITMLHKIISKEQIK
ncbi:hypothetical protein [Anaerospora hongkongensis]|uniref:hypothetical protein n=1 Tax=Anaerospora hongkongensis TaxID=244830 RepID=UPI00289E0CB6|nr:hypothetical protein [Anaerospora hongkongensis]